ncbi:MULTISPECIES: hypothetical protein [Bradyrhizobium]|jgi:hypothetical protein|uniref:Uncharacterized protein n=1 Tax=Bradyrhizobium elkanii TaxID=29448 RepID=A0ABV4EU63_BRAEL|nr:MULTISPECIES: hypothetical protein [Bradyrhizobium]MCP1755714.1 hypothetical protein [Bradyrhizobium elkanii]MCP1929391.1 hypothetical protein [Bradyrhizobium elkanii]MCP1981230.1 hypothetical protein [Bradyrhizobium elkanii]MCS3452292.1 hypothetical protein [Bradyrhizobium elkanii]MCS3473289.1 hypothetical protein [Bradyrhizobium elkanii]
MRLDAWLMDHFGLHRLFGLTSTLDLFGSAAHRAHYTSVLRYPVLKRFGNYAGASRVIEETLADELAVLPKAWLVPFGPNAVRALEYLAAAGRIDDARILDGILHPGGQQWNRYNVQLGLVFAMPRLRSQAGLKFCGEALCALEGRRPVWRRRAALDRSLIFCLQRAGRRSVYKMSILRTTAT